MPIKNMFKLHALLMQACLLLVAIPVFAQPAIAFEGDYIWEDRFRMSLEKALSGDLKAQFSVGNMYHKGRGIQVNDTKALSWFLMAAEQGSYKAAYKAGYLYLHSEELVQSPQKALPWLEKAAATGYPPAQYELGLVYGRGLAGQWDSARALTLLGESKLAGYKPAVAAFDMVVSRLVKSNTKLVVKPLLQPNEQLQSNEGVQSNEPNISPAPQIAQARFRPKIVSRMDPKKTILASRWDGRNGPSTYLPSKMTNCQEQDSIIECVSSKLTRQVASTAVTYRIRTRISDIQENGQFRINYANKVLSATDETGARSLQIKTGWQLTEHSLECAFDPRAIDNKTKDSQMISCFRGGARQFQLTAR